METIDFEIQQKEWIQRAVSLIDKDKLVELVVEMTNIPSATGYESELAKFMVECMKKAGLDAFYQEMDENRGNAIGRLRGSGQGYDLLLYSHLDTTFSGDQEKDYPALGGTFRPDLTPAAYIQGGAIRGLGAGNPKGAGACALIAMAAVHNAGIPLAGDVTLGLAAGGIHKCQIDGIHRAYRGREYLGYGMGCEYMLKAGVRADYAINTKPGYTVAWEEPGSCWFKVSVKGTMNYAGLRHVMSYKNPIVDAAKVVLALEEWCEEYPERNRSGLIEPQAAIGSIEAGWPFKPEIIPSLCNIYLDVRTNSETDPMEVKRQFAEAIAGIQKNHPELLLEWEMYLSAPGSKTDKENWIVQSCIRAWEYVEGQTHVERTGTSGVSDGNILRAWGIPTARLGAEGLSLVGDDGKPLFGDSLDIENIVKLTKCYVYAIIETCTRKRMN